MDPRLLVFPKPPKTLTMLSPQSTLFLEERGQISILLFTKCQKGRKVPQIGNANSNANNATSKIEPWLY